MSEAAASTPYSAEYLSLLARKGKLASKKIDNVWYTTKSILDAYMKRQMLRAQVESGQIHELPQTNATAVVGPDLSPAPLLANERGETQSAVPAPQPAKVVVAPAAVAALPNIRSYRGDIKAHLSSTGTEVPKEYAHLIADESGAPAKISQQDLSGLPMYAPQDIVPEAGYPKELPPEASIISDVERALERVFDRRSKPAAGASKTRQAAAKVLSAPHRSFRTVTRSHKLLTVALVTAAVLTIFPIPFAFSFFENALGSIKSTLTDANTVLGARPGTHRNELLLLDKNGDAVIMGHVEGGQLVSSAADGVPPIVVDSKTQVDNLNASYLDGASSTDFTLAFVTANGAMTTEDVTLGGSVEVGKTLSVKGATKLASALSVGGGLTAFGNAEFKKALDVLGPASFKGIVSVENDLSAAGDITSGGNLSSGGNISSNGDIVSGGSLSVGTNADVHGSLSVGGAVIGQSASFSSLGVISDFSARGRVALGGSGQPLTISASNATLTENGDANFTGLLTAGNISTSGAISGDHITLSGSATSTFAGPVEFNGAVAFLVGRITSLAADSISVGALTATNSTTTNATTTNAYVSALTADNSTTTNATSTSSYSHIGTFDDLYVNNYQQNDGTFTIHSTVPTGDVFSVFDTAVTDGTLIHQSLTANAGNGQSSKGQIIDLVDSTTAGGGYSALTVNVSGTGTGSGAKLLLDLNPSATTQAVFDSTGSFRPTTSSATNSNSIGSPSYYWKNGYFDTLTANNIAGTVTSGDTASHTWTIGSTETGDANEALIFQRNSGSGNATFQWNRSSGTLNDQRYLSVDYPFNSTYTVSDSSISPSANLYSGLLTNNTTSGTQKLLSLTNTGTGTTENGIYIDNTGTAQTALEIHGAWTTGIKTNNNSIDAGTGSLSAGSTTLSSLNNSGSTVYGTVSIADHPTGGAIGTAAATVDVSTSFNVAQTTAGQTLTIPSPTSATAGRIAIITNTGTAAFTLLGATLNAGSTAQIVWNGSAWVGGGSSGWGLTGNSSTNPATNFLGTTDAQPLVIKTNNSEAMRVLSNGNVGIGTTNPGGVKLNIVGSNDMLKIENTDGTTANQYAQMELKAGTADNYIWTNNQNSAGYYGGSNALNIYGGSGSPLAFFTNAIGTPRMVIDTSGNVGIGTTNPSLGHLQVTGTNVGQQIYAVSSATTGSNYGVDAEASGAGATLNVGGYFYVTGATTNYGVQIAGPAAATNNYALYSSSAAQSYFAGNVGIGLTNPSYKLDVSGTINLTGVLYGNGKEAITTGDTYLRLNNSSAFSSGVYTPGNLRADGTIYTGGTSYYISSGTSNLNGLNVGGNITTNGALIRNVSGAGYLSGNYPSSETGGTSGAIYSIGGGYTPGTTSLGNMYGIGYSVNNNGTSGFAISGAPVDWGLYVAAGGTAHAFIQGSSGTLYTDSGGGVAIEGGANAIMNSNQFYCNSSSACHFNWSGSGVTNIGNAAGIFFNGTVTQGASQYIYPGFQSGQGSGTNGSYYIAGSTSWGLYSNTSLNAQGLYDAGNRVCSATTSPCGVSISGNASTATLASTATINTGRTDAAWYQAMWAVSGGTSLYSTDNVAIYSGSYGAISFNSHAWTLEGNATYGLYSNTGFDAAGGLYDVGSRVCSGQTCNIGSQTMTVGVVNASGLITSTVGVQIPDRTGSGDACNSSVEGKMVYSRISNAGETHGEMVICSRDVFGSTTLYRWFGFNWDDTESVTTLYDSTSPDLAEYVPVQDDSIAAGEIMSVSDVPNPTGTKPYDTFYAERATSGNAVKMLGIVSTNPGYILNDPKVQSANLDDVEKGPDLTGLKPLALAGRVPVKVTTENGEVKAGDYVTISDTTPGQGMRATDAGEVVGQALDDYDPSTGEVLVLVGKTFWPGQLSLKDLDTRLSNVETALADATSTLALLQGVASSTSSRLDALELRVSALDGGTASSSSDSTSSSQAGPLPVGLTLDATTTQSIVGSVLASLGASFADGIAHFGSLVVDALTVGSHDHPTGITLYDSITGDPYCLTVASGVQRSAPGACGAGDVGADLSQPSPESGEGGPGSSTASSTPPADLSGTSPDSGEVDAGGAGEVSSSTPGELSASSTPPVIGSSASSTPDTSSTTPPTA